MQCPECGCEFEANDSGDAEGAADAMDPMEGSEMGAAGSDQSTPFKASISQGGAASGAPLAAGAAAQDDPKTKRLLMALEQALGGR